MPALAGARRSLTLARTERRRVVSSRFFCQPDAAGTDIAGTSYTRLDGRALVQSPRVPVRGLQVLCRGGQTNATTAGGEVVVDAANDVAIELAIELAGATTRVQRGGTDVWMLGAGERNVLTDPAGLTIPPSTAFYLRYGQSIASTSLKMHRPIPAGGTVQNVVSYSSGAASQVGGTGAITVANASGTAWGPTALIGEPLGVMQAVGWLGMSITGGTGDVNPNPYGNAGYVSKGLDLVNPAIPRLGLSRGSSFMQSFLANSADRIPLLPFLDWVFVDFGTNDIKYNAATLASLQTQARQVWALARAAGCRVIACTIIPRMASSTDGYTTPGNMTPQAGFEAGGLRDGFNAWLDTALGNGWIEGVCDTSLGRYRLAGGSWTSVPGGGIEDPNNPSKFRTDGGQTVVTVADGTHPTSGAGNGVAMMALAVQAVGTAIGLGNS